jgi:adenylate cyclase, class 2
MSTRDGMETELKVRVPSLEGLGARLGNLGFVPLHPAQPEHSTLWDLDGRLHSRGEALRVRVYGGRTLLTWKGPRRPDPCLKIRPERETEVADRGELEAILRALGYAPVLEMVKERAVHSRTDATVCLDRTPFGCFVELEGEPGVIQALQEGLGLAEAPVETRSYPALHVLHGS